MARARTATVMSTPREPASFQTICLACSTAELGRQLLPNPRLQGRQTRACGLMSALAYGADGADAGGSVSVHVASGGQEHTEDRGHRTHVGPHSRPELTAQHDPHCREVADETVIRTRPRTDRRRAHVNSSSSLFASFRSAVSKPSVNQP